MLFFATFQYSKWSNNSITLTPRWMSNDRVINLKRVYKKRNAIYLMDWDLNDLNMEANDFFFKTWLVVLDLGNTNLWIVNYKENVLMWPGPHMVIIRPTPRNVNYMPKLLALSMMNYYQCFLLMFYFSIYSFSTIYSMFGFKVEFWIFKHLCLSYLYYFIRGQLNVS